MILKSAKAHGEKNDEPPTVVNLVKQALQPGAVVARIAREHNINDNLLFNWKRLYEEGLLNDEDLQECQAVPVAITETPDPVKPVTNPFWRNKSDESQNDTTVDSPQCELHLKSGVVKLFAPSLRNCLGGSFAK